MILGVFALAFGTASAQDGNGYWWQPSPVICNPYAAEQQAAANMSPEVRALYNATQTKTDEILDATRNIYCNPPKSAPTTTPTPVTTPTPSPIYYNYGGYGTARSAN